MNYLVFNKKADNGHGCCTAKEKAKELFEDYLHIFGGR